MVLLRKIPDLETSPKTPLLSATIINSSSSNNSESEQSPQSSNRFVFNEDDSTNKIDRISVMPSTWKSPSSSSSYKSLAILSGHIGSVSCLALCGEFVLSASQGKDIIVWQQPDLKKFAKFGHGDGSVKALVTVGNRVFTAHQDSKIRVWKVSRSSENLFKLVSTLPTTKDYLGKFMRQSNYVQIRRNHKCLWIEHVDSISCLAVSNGLVYSGSWDKTLKIWRVSDLKCLESIKAHDDAINGLVAEKGRVYSASADGKIKIWNGIQGTNTSHFLKRVLVGHKDVSLNSVIICENGRFVYGGGSDGYIMGWEENQGNGDWNLVCEVKAHNMSVLCLSFMGDYICSGSADKSIGIWKREKTGGGICNVGFMNGHEGPVKCLQASLYSVGGGFLLYSGGLDRSLRVWWVPIQDEHKTKKKKLIDS